METGMKQNPTPQIEPLFTVSFLLLLTAILLFTTGYGVFYLFPLFVLDLGGDTSDIGILMGVAFLSGVFGRPWISTFVDRIGRKASLVAGSLLMIIVSVTHIFFNGPIDQVYPVLILLRVIFGVSFALGMVAGLTMAADLSPASRLTQGLGFFLITPFLGIAIGPVVAESMVHRWGFNAMFLTALAIFGAALVALMPLRDHFVRSGGMTGGNFFKVLQMPLVWRMSIICLFFGVGFAAHGSFVAPFAETSALPVSAYFVAYSVAAVLARIFGGNIAGRFNEIWVIPAALMIAGLGFICLMGVSTTPGLAGTGFVAGLGHGLLFPSLFGLTMRPLPAANRGKVTGILTGGFDLGMFIGSLIMGQMGELFGFSIIFATAAVTIFLGLGVFFWIRPMIVSR